MFHPGFPTGYFRITYGTLHTYCTDVISTRPFVFVFLVVGQILEIEQK